MNMILIVPSPNIVLVSYALILAYTFVQLLKALESGDASDDRLSHARGSIGEGEREKVCDCVARKRHGESELAVRVEENLGSKN